MTEQNRVDDIASGKGNPTKPARTTDEAARDMLNRQDSAQRPQTGEATQQVEPGEPKLEDPDSGFDSAYTDKGVSADAPEGVQAEPVTPADDQH